MMDLMVVDLMVTDPTVTVDPRPTPDPTTMRDPERAAGSLKVSVPLLTLLTTRRRAAR